MSLTDALDYVGGYLLVADISVPHDTFYRPSIRLKARDGFCPLAPAATPRAAINNPNALTIRTYVDGVLQQSVSTGDVVRSVEQLLVDVTEFMTLSPGDVLATGIAARRASSASGAECVHRSRWLGNIELQLREAHMMFARVAYAGAIHQATPTPPWVTALAGVRLADGRVLNEDEVVWLPPFEAGTIIALGLNYADHAKELAFNALEEEPLVVPEGAVGSLIGHRGETRRPDDAAFMHYVASSPWSSDRPRAR